MQRLIHFLRLSQHNDSGSGRTNKLLGYFFLFLAFFHFAGIPKTSNTFGFMHPVILSMLGGGCTILFAFYLVYKNLLNWALLLYFIETVVIVYVFTLYLGFLNGTVIGIITLPLLIFLGHFKLWLKLLSAILSTVLLILFAMMAHEQDFEYDTHSLIDNLAGNMGFAVFIISVVCYIFHRSVQTAEARYILEKTRADEQRKLVEEKNKEILDSINYAKRIQSAILPPNKLVKEFLKESFILYKPKDIVAGDFYWIESVPGDVPKNIKILFAAADCTGHGVPGAMVSVVCNNALNRSVREYGLTNPAEILNKTREMVITEFEKSDEEVKDGMDIALCSLEGNNLQYAGANNPLWIIRKGEIKADKQPIGNYDKLLPFTCHSIDLQDEDSLYIFSDGYVDQFGEANGKKFKAKAFRELLLNIYTNPMEEQKQLINQCFENWRGSTEQVDDVCVIGVRI